MHEAEHRLQSLAANHDNIVDRCALGRIGWSDREIHTALRAGWLQQLHPGVYLVGAAKPTWRQSVRAAVRAAGEAAQASHRTAFVLWDLDGIASAPVELVVPYSNDPVPRRALVHRSRRIEPASVIDGIPVTSVERTLLEVGAMTSAVVVEKGFCAAWRRNLTSPEKCRHYLDEHAGKGRRGSRMLRAVVDLYEGTGLAPGSDGEVAFLRLLRAAGIEEPVRQLVVRLPDGSKVRVDFAWPDRRKLVEFVGLGSHADSRAHARDTLREDDIKTVGWALRRFAPDTLRTNPEEVARRVLRFLCGSSYRPGR